MDFPGTPLRYRRDVERWSVDAIGAETAHVRAHLSSVAAADDDPDTHAGEVWVSVVAHIDGDPNMVSIVGVLNRPPAAPYLRDDFDPSAEDGQFRFVPYEDILNGLEADWEGFRRWERQQREAE